MPNLTGTSVTSYQTSDTGNAAPQTNVTGGSTLLNGPQGVASDGDHLDPVSRYGTPVRIGDTTEDHGAASDADVPELGRAPVLDRDVPDRPWRRHLVGAANALQARGHPAAILGAWHYYWLVKADVLQPLIYAAILVLLLALRLRKPLSLPGARSRPLP